MLLEFKKTRPRNKCGATSWGCGETMLVNLLSTIVSPSPALVAGLRGLVFIILFSLTSCLHLYSTPSLDLDVPKGPPAFRAGWYDGCRSALSTRRSTLNFVYNPTFGNGIYQDNSDYQNGWGIAFNICATASGTYQKLGMSPWGHDLFTERDFE